MSLKEFRGTFIKEIDKVEAERRAEEERARTLHEWAVLEAEDQLSRYAKLIEEAEGVLSKNAVGVERTILRSLYDKREPSPHYVASEARLYCEILEEDLRKARAKAEAERRRTLLVQEGFKAALQFIASKKRYDAMMAHEKRIIPELSRWGYQPDQIWEIEKFAKKHCAEVFKKELDEKLRGNPYSWYYHTLMQEVLTT